MKLVIKMPLGGGLHIHTTCSDGRLTPQEAADAYQEQGFDFIAFTDHDYPLKPGTNGIYKKIKKARQSSGRIQEFLLREPP